MLHLVLQNLKKIMAKTIIEIQITEIIQVKQVNMVQNIKGNSYLKEAGPRWCVLLDRNIVEAASKHWLIIVTILEGYFYQCSGG